MAANGAGPRPVVFNHVGICVRDLQRARTFYEEALGFRYWWELEAPEEGTSVLLEVPRPVGLKAVYLLRDGLVLELLHFSSAPLQPSRERVMTEPGLTHMSFAVHDISEALERVVAYGGQVMENTDVKLAIMIRDPDGQLIELTASDWQASLPPRPE